MKNVIFRYCTRVASEKVIPRWEQDYQLQPVSKLGLFYEYLEMGKKGKQSSSVPLSATFTAAHLEPVAQDVLKLKHSVITTQEFGDLCIMKIAKPVAPHTVILTRGPLTLHLARD